MTPRSVKDDARDLYLLGGLIIAPWACAAFFLFALAVRLAQGA